MMMGKTVNYGKQPFYCNINAPAVLANFFQLHNLEKQNFVTPEFSIVLDLKLTRKVDVFFFLTDVKCFSQNNHFNENKIGHTTIYTTGTIILQKTSSTPFS